MSPRVTRSSSAKTPADTSLANSATSAPTTSSRKRKTSAEQPPAAAAPPDPDQRTSKRVRLAPTAPSSKASKPSPTHEKPPIAPPKRGRRPRAAAMSSNADSPEDVEASAPGSSKRTSGKNRKQSSGTPPPPRPSSSSKNRKSSHRRLKEAAGDSADDGLLPPPPPPPPADDPSDASRPTSPPQDDEPASPDFMEALFRRGPLGILQSIAGPMPGVKGRLRALLDQIKQKEDPEMQFLAMQELSEVLLVSNEDTLAGQFSPDAFVKEFVTLLQPPEDGVENPEMMLVACRCIANLIEALPAATATIVYSGAVPVLISKLLTIEYMDLAEQALTTLEKISAEFPASITRNGGLTACLQFLDFFPTSTQRTAVTTAANCCRNIPDDSFDVVKNVMPNLLNVLNGNDQRVVEQGCLCVARIVDSFRRQDSRMEELMSREILQAILRLLLPGSSNLVSPHIHTSFLRVLSTTARASPRLTVELLKMNVVETLYQVLTGISPPSGDDDVAQRIDSVLIMQALIHRPKEQVFETLNVINELLPDLDAEGLGYMGGINSSGSSRALGDEPEARTLKIAAKRDALKECKQELKRFAVILFPTLTDAYSSTVNFSVREKVLTAQLKMLCTIDTEILEVSLRAVPYASFLASILTQQDQPFLLTAALQAANLLLKRLEPIYRYQFYREGVFAEVKRLAERPVEATRSSPEAPPATNEPATEEAENIEPVEELASASEPQIDLTEPHSASDDDDEDIEDDEDMDDDVPYPPGIEEDDEGEDEEDSSSTSSSGADRTRAGTTIISIQDKVTESAKDFTDRWQTEQSRLYRTKAEKTLQQLNYMVSDIRDCYESGRSDEGRKLFEQFAEHFQGDALESITSYELLNSKAVNGLLEALGDMDDTSNADARAAFAEIFMGTSTRQKLKSQSVESPATPFSVLVSKLQDLLSRSEHFEVVTVHQNSYDSNRTSTATMLSKQIRLRLVADGDASEIPAPLRNIIVSVHAIANFKAIDDYLRPRIALAERPRHKHRDFNGGESAGGAPSSSSKPLPEDQPTPASTSKSSGRRSSARRSSTKGKEEPTTPSPATSSPTASQPRRASRKSKAEGQEESTSPLTSPVLAEDEANTQPDSQLECADETHLSDDEALDDTEPVGGIVEDFEDDTEPNPAAVNMEVAPTGKVTARQEDGTRISTPTPSQGGVRPPNPSAYSAGLARSLLSLSGLPMSYAAAVQAPPTDWHLEFSINGRKIDNALTVYRAVHNEASAGEEGSSRSLWYSTHTINFRRASGPAPSDSGNPVSVPATPTVSSSGLPLSLDQNPITAVILRLLKVLHSINANLDDVLHTEHRPTHIRPEPLTQFVNTKLTAKMNRQLEEPLIVASNCLPGWSEDLARLYPFLFPFETRHVFLQSTAFGYARSVSRWQNNQPEDNRRNRYSDERPFMGKLSRQKVRIMRTKMLESAAKVMEMYGNSSSILEIEYFDEVGTGLGPTLEFYSHVSKEFSSKRLQLWRENESNGADQFVFGKQGLFPAPMSERQAASPNGQRILGWFRVLGKFVARSMLDSRIIDISFNPVFFRLDPTEGSMRPSFGTLKHVDEDLARSLQTLKQFALSKKKIEQSHLSPSQKAQKMSRIQVAGAAIEDLSLDFTLPGYSAIELVSNGANIPVTIDNVDTYIHHVLDMTLGSGVYRQAEAFRAGFSQVFAYNALRAFTPAELVMLFGRAEEDWSLETLTDSIKADHGYNMDSKTVQNLLQLMSSFSTQTRREFLQFVTGSPKLPIGGFKALTPMFTVVLRSSDPGHVPDEYLPSCMTCVNYLKMPNYSTAEMMHDKLNIAIHEGQGAFHLS